MHGTGNDYIYINCFTEKVDNPYELAKKLSNRHFGIGSDGLVLICPSSKADFRMDMYNSDGTQAEMLFVPFRLPIINQTSHTSVACLLFFLYKWESPVWGDRQGVENDTLHYRFRYAIGFEFNSKMLYKPAHIKPIYIMICSSLAVRLSYKSIITVE